VASASTTIALTGEARNFDLTGWADSGNSTVFTRAASFGTVALDTVGKTVTYALDNSAAGWRRCRAGRPFRTRWRWW
jgi:hypothetical protein